MLFNNNSNDLFFNNYESQERIEPCFAFVEFDKDMDLFPKNEKDAESNFSDSLMEGSTDTDNKLDSPLSSVQAPCFTIPQQSADYNAMVNEIIQISYSTKRGEEKAEEVPAGDALIRNRRKLRKREVAFLEKKFELKQEWDKAYINELANEIGLPYYKIYKWNWDMKKKSEKSKSQLGKRMREAEEPMNTKRFRSSE